MGPGLLSTLTRLESAPLDALMAEYPAQWEEVGARLVEASKAGPGGLEHFIAELTHAAQPWKARVKKSHANPKVVAAALGPIAAARMGKLAVERMLASAATGVTQGTVRLGLWSGLVVQRLLFRRGLERKPVSMAAFRFAWPLVADRRKVMPLVQQRGIYCFFSRELVAALAKRLAGQQCLEVAAGDGTLSRLLAEAGLGIRATDDQTWTRVVDYPANVERLDAAKAVQTYRAPAVLCCFPPPGNAFERRILGTPHVKTYIVITTKHRFAAGDWGAYESAKGWAMKADEALSSLVLPPEVDPLVLWFDRR
jgi:hypothetical protein